MKFCLALTGLLTTTAMTTLQQDDLGSSTSSFFETKATPKKLGSESSKASTPKANMDAHLSVGNKVHDQYTNMVFSNEDINDFESSPEINSDLKKEHSSLDEEIKLASLSHPSPKADASLSFQGLKAKDLDNSDEISTHLSPKIHTTTPASSDARTAILDFLSIPNPQFVPLATVSDETQSKHLSHKASERSKDDIHEVPSITLQDIKKTKINSELSSDLSKKAGSIEKVEKEIPDYTSKPSKATPEEPPKATAIIPPQMSAYSKNIGQEAQNKTGVNPPGARPSPQSVRSLPNASAAEVKPSPPTPEATQSLAKNMLPVTFNEDKKPDGSNNKKEDYTSVMKLAILPSASAEAKSTTPPIMTTDAPLATGTPNPPEDFSASLTEAYPVGTSLETEAPRTTQILTTPTESPKEDQPNGPMGFEACASYQRFCRDILCHGAEEVEMMDCNDGGTCQCKPDSDPIKSHGMMSESIPEPQGIPNKGRNSTFRNSRTNNTKAYMSVSSSSTHTLRTIPTILTYLAFTLCLT